MEISKKNRSELKKYFLANMIPLEGHFAALIDAGINQVEDGIAKLPGNPLSLQAEGEPSGTLDVLHLYRNFEDETPRWMLNLNPEMNPNEPGSSSPGLNIKDVNGASRFFLKENDGHLGLGTVSPKAKLDLRDGAIYAGTTDNISGENPQVKLLLNHTDESHDKGHTHGTIGWIGTGRNSSSNLSASISAGSRTWDDQGYLSFATSDGADNPKERIRITEQGRVGIGLTTPSEKLEIEGKVKASHFIGDGSGLTNLSIGDTGLNLALDKSARVGIGTSSPNYKLEVSGGNARINDLFLGDVGHGAHWAGFSHSNVNGPDSYGFMQSAEGNITLMNKKSGGGFIGFRVDDKDKMVLLDNGQLGIGTSKPIHQLEVHGDTDVVLFQSTKDTTYLRLANNEGLKNRVEFANRKGGRAAIWVADAGDALNVTREGKVGIGATQPEAPLSILGDGKENEPDAALHLTNDCLLFGGNNAGKQSDSAQISAGKHVKNSLNIVGMSSGTDHADRRIDLWAEGGMQVHGMIGIGHLIPQAPISIKGNGKENEPDIALHLTNDCLLFGGNNAGKQADSAQISAGKHVKNSLNIVGMSSGTDHTDRKIDLWAEGGMCLHGNLGIGLSSPSEKLEVAGVVKATKFIGDGSGLTNLGGGEAKLNLALEQEEKVGIGTSSPNKKLDVKGDVLIEGSDNKGKNACLTLKAGNQTMLIDGNEIDAQDTPLYLNFNSNKNILIGSENSDGAKVGIGTYKPSEKLEVSGTVKATKFIGDGSRLTNLNIGEAKLYLALEKDEKVGIGTDKPNQKLTIKNGGIGFDNNSEDKKLYSPVDGLLEWVTHSAAEEHAFAVSHQGDPKVYLSTEGNSYLKGGNLGIGINEPQAPLSIKGKGKERSPDSALHITESCILFGGNNAGKQMDSAQISAGKHEPNSLNIIGMSDESAHNRRIHLWAEGGMLVNGVVTAHDFRKHSDRRIKKDIKISDPHSDLETLSQIQITDYHFIDKDRYDEQPQKKIIAQQVMDVYPAAVTNQTKEVVPDVFKEARIEKGVVSLEDHGLRPGEKIKVTLHEVDESEEAPMNEIYEVLESTTDSFKITSNASGKVFVYGREVDDFCTVDMDALGMLNISATQALHQMLDKLTKDHQELEQKLQQLSPQPE